MADEDDDRLLRRQELLNGVNAVETDKKRLLAGLFKRRHATQHIELR